MTGFANHVSHKFPMACPFCRRALARLARVYMGSGDYAKAAATLERALFDGDVWTFKIQGPPQEWSKKLGEPMGEETLGDLYDLMLCYEATGMCHTTVCSVMVTCACLAACEATL